MAPPINGLSLTLITPPTSRRRSTPPHFRGRQPLPRHRAPTLLLRHGPRQRLRLHRLRPRPTADSALRRFCYSGHDARRNGAEEVVSFLAGAEAEEMELALEAVEVRISVCKLSDCIERL